MGRIQLDPYLEKRGWQSTAWLGLFVHADYPDVTIGKMDDGTYQVTKGKNRIGENLSVEDAVRMATNINESRQFDEVGYEDPEHMLRLHQWRPNDNAPITSPDQVYVNPSYPGMTIQMESGHGMTLRLNGKKIGQGFDANEILGLVEKTARSSAKPNTLESRLLDRVDTLLQEQSMRMNAGDVTPVQHGTEDFARIVQEIRSQEQRYALMMQSVGTNDMYALFWYAVGRAGYNSPDQIRNAKRQYDTIMGIRHINKQDED